MLAVDAMMKGISSCQEPVSGERVRKKGTRDGEQLFGCVVQRVQKRGRVDSTWPWTHCRLIGHNNGKGRFLRF